MAVVARSQDINDFNSRWRYHESYNYWHQLRDHITARSSPRPSVTNSLTAPRRPYPQSRINIVSGRLKERAARRAVEYWQGLLKGSAPCRLPPPRNRVELSTLKAHAFHIVDTQTITRACLAAATDLPSLIQASWALVLGAYSVTDDITFAYKQSGRDLPVEGRFLDVIPHRLLIDDKMSKASFLRKVKSRHMEHMYHQHCSQSELEGALDLKVDQVCNTILSVKSQKRDDSSFQVIPRASLVRQNTNYDVAVTVLVGRRTMDVEIQYWSGKISEFVVQNMASSLEIVLLNLMENPDALLSEIDLLSDADRRTIWSWNEYLPPRRETCVHAEFEKQARSRPNHQAIASFDQNFTYNELDEVSEQLANHLAKVGVKPGVMVPLCFDKSCWAVVAMLAVLKAGGACVSLSPTYPKARMQLILKELSSRILLASSDHERLFTDLDVHTIAVDSSTIQALSSNDSCARIASRHTDPAFVVYTSGSTGKPKGVVIEHGAMTTSAAAHGPAFGIGHEFGSRALQFANYTFDASIQDIFTSLQRGGTIAIVSEQERVNDLEKAINDRQANFAELTPSVASLLDPTKVPTMKYMSVGGESLTEQVIKKWATSVRLLNTWGPSEASINASCSSPLTTSARASNIGRAVGCRLWIVDPRDHNRLCPIGVTGELVIEGNILARGYLHDPDKTNAAFICNPTFLRRHAFGSRIYKTGDLAVYASDGSIDFVGRSDYQVKLHGQRFELGEVEHHLRALVPDARAVIADVISPFRDQPNRRLLAAYIDIGSHAAADGVILHPTEDFHKQMKPTRQSLAELLPPYMVPSLFVPMGSLPMSSSAKVDRKRIRAMTSKLRLEDVLAYSLDTKSNKRAPSTKMERTLQRAWSRVLSITEDSIGADDHFLSLGGDSLAAMRLASEARVEGVTLTVASIMRMPELSAMALTAHEVDPMKQLKLLQPFDLCPISRAQVAALCGVHESTVEDAYPCSPLQEGLMAATQRQPLAYTAREIFRLDDGLDIELFMQTWSKAFDAYAILRTRIIAYESQAIQVVTRSKLNWETTESLDDYLAKDKATPMTYGSPLWRFAVVASRDFPERYFVMTAHHSAYDGWFEDNLWASLLQYYCHGELKTSKPFVNFINHVENIDKEASVKYWERQLTGGAPVSFPTLPFHDYEPRANHTLSHKIQLVLPRGGKILPSALLRAAWALLVSNHADSDDIIFAATQSGREIPVQDIENVAGPTITTVPIRLKLDRSMTIAQYLCFVRDQAIEMIDHEHFGLQNIQQISKETRDAMQLRSLFLVQPSLPDRDPDAQSLGAHRKSGGEGQSFDAFALNMECFLDGIDILLQAKYDHEVISDCQMELIMQQFSHIINLFGVQPDDTPIDRLDFVSESEKSLIEVWNGDRPLPLKACIHHIIHENALLAPQAEAICSFDGSMLYGELDALSNNLAHHLIQLGVVKEMPVPLLLEKGRFTIVAQLAVVRAGGVATSLDPQQPMKRLQEMIFELGEFTTLVASRRIAAKFKELAKSVVEIDEDFVRSLPTMDGEPCMDLSSDNAAFIVHTSGSTGKPKKIVLEHRAIATSSRAHGSAMGITSSTRTLQFAAFTYDVSIQDVFTTLQRGGCVCVISDEERFNDLTGAINRTQANWADLTSSVAEFLHPDKVPTLKTISLGGEPLKPSVAKTWESRDGVTVINGYGPAECSINSTCSTTEQRRGNPANIGFPLSLWAFVIDACRRDRLAPIGCSGELWLEGPLLARCYKGDPQKTAEAFVESPKWAPGRRFYATGDLVRYDATNGSLIYIGRADKQIKIHGQRVELGEIENQILKAGPLEVAVELISTSRMQGRKTLASFMVLQTTQKQTSEPRVLDLSSELETTLSEIRLRAMETLPTHMVPALYLPLPSLPRNASGKLDRRTLHQIAEFTEEIDRYSLQKVARVVITDSIAIRLRDIWAEILKVDPETIGAADNFFASGGDSISAMRLVGKSRRAGLTMTVAIIFQHPRLADMASKISEDDAPLPSATAPFGLVPPDVLESVMVDAENQCLIDRSTIEDVYPSTAMQDGLMAITAKQANAYTAQNVYRLPKHIDRDNFMSAWQLVYKAHGILRTRLIYSLIQKRFYQIVISDDLDWRCSDDIEEYIRTDSAEPFEQGVPLARWGIIDVSQDTYFVFTAHHAVYDGWSFQQMFEDVARVYNGVELQPATPMRAFISYLTSQSLENQETFWVRELEGETSHWPQPPVGNIPARQVVTISKNFPSSSMSRATVLPSLILRAAWALTLSQFSMSDDVTFGLTLSGRNVSVDGVTEIVGPLLTTVPMRVKIDRSSTVAQYLDQLQQHANEMIEYQHYGLQNIHSLQRKRGNSFELQNILIIQPADEKESHTTRLGLEIVDRDSGDFDTYPLNVEVLLDDEKTVIDAVFEASTLSSRIAERLLDQYIHMTQQLAQANDQSLLRDLDVINAADKAWLRELNANVPEKIKSTVHGEIEKQTILTNNAEAIVSFDRNFTYEQLIDTARSLACMLMTLGVGPGVFVPICFDKSSYAILSMVAVLEAGGAYVAVSHTYPKDRLKLILDDTSAKLILASPQHASIFHDLGGTPIEVFGVDDEFLATCPATTEYKPSQVRYSDPAYIIYTSGSTGRPKGVIIEHGQIVSSSAAHGAAYGHGPGTRVAQFASYYFDASVQDIMTTLQRGGTIVVISEEERMGDLAGAINRRGANYLDITPSVAALLAPSEVPTLRTLSLGGEMLTEQVLKAWLNHGTRLLNTYGPTECSVNSNYAPILDSQFSVANIGKGLGCILWVVRPDDHQQLVPVGCIGEMLIEGPIVGRGYLNDEEKTRNAFVSGLNWLPADPLSQARRMYKTGDLVKYREDGGMEYCGRKDQQVKINGLRIELGEITSQIKASSDQVEGVAVEVVQPDDRGRKKTLAAFVNFRIPSGTETRLLDMTDTIQPTFMGIRDHLVSSLPLYMVPTLFLPISRLPTNVSGKLDRKLLRSLVEHLDSDVLTSYSLASGSRRFPSSEMEQLLARLWAETLGLEQQKIMAEDNFFQIGGASIQAMQLSSAARLNGLQLMVASIFKNPRLCDMARHADATMEAPAIEYVPFSLCAESDRKRTPQIAELCESSIEDIEDILPTTALQEGMMSITSRQPDAYVAQFAFKISPSLDIDRLKACWEFLYQKHPILRTRIVHSSTGRALQVVMKEKLEWVETGDWEEHLKLDAKMYMTYGTKLSRFACAQHKDGSKVLLMTLHHDTYDNWMLEQLYDDLHRSYQNDQIDESVAFSTFIRHQQTLSKSAAKQFWQHQLKGTSHVSWPSIPAQHEVRSTELMERTISLSKIKSSEFTLPTLLRAAFALTIGLFADSQDIVFAETLSGRDTSVAGATQIVAPLLTTVPARYSTSLSTTVSQYLKQVQTQSIELIEHQHTGLQNIKRLLNDGQSLPEQHTAFIVQPLSEKEDGIEALGLEPLEISTGDFDTFPLNFTCSLEPSVVDIDVAFDPDVVAPTMMGHFLNTFDKTLEMLSTSNRNTSLGDLDLMGKASIDAVVASSAVQIPWNGKSERLQPGRSWVVDQENCEKLVPPGCIGELLVEGPVSDLDCTTLVNLDDPPRWRRLLNLPLLSHSFSLTGVLVRHDASGELQFLGNKADHRKLHGQRINVLEIEKLIASVDDINSAFVVIPSIGFYAQRLVCCFTAVMDGDHADDTSGDIELVTDEKKVKLTDQVATSLQKTLQLQLPQHMIPTVYIAWNHSKAMLEDRFIAANKLQSRIEEIGEARFQWLSLHDHGIEKLLSTPANKAERVLQNACAHVLNLPLRKINLESSFVTLGGDSISAMQIVSRARGEGIILTVPLLLRSKSVTEAANGATSSGETEMVVKNVDVDQSFPLTPIQRWYFENLHRAYGEPSNRHYNQSYLARVIPNIHPDSMMKALNTIVTRHPMLRARFQAENNMWSQRIVTDGNDVYHWATPKVSDLQGLSQVWNKSQTSLLDIEKGPVFSVDYIDAGSDRYLLMIAHHLVVDLVSWRIIVEELETIINGVETLQQVPLSFQTWARSQALLAQTASYAPEKVLSTAEAISDSAYWGLDETVSNTTADQLSRTVEVDAATTALILGTANAPLKTEPLDLLMVGVWVAFFSTFKDRKGLTIFNEGHGREPWEASLDPSQTIGWFTTMFPIHVNRLETEDSLEVLKRVKDYRRQVRENGFAYFTSRYLNEDGLKKFSNHSLTEVVFNYFGLSQSLEAEEEMFAEISLPKGLTDITDQGKSVPTDTIFEISVQIADDKAEFSVDYNKGVKYGQKVAEWIDLIPSTLKVLCHQLSIVDGRLYSLSDFPLMKLDYPGLYELENLVRRKLKLSSLDHVEDVYPCTPLQEGILLSQARIPGSYETEHVWEIKPSGGLMSVNVMKLISAWKKVVEQHSTLRTVFIDAVEDSAFDQIVIKDYSPNVVSTKSSDIQGALSNFKKLAKLDYTKARPPHRLSICSLPSGSVVCRFEASHTITDGGSGEVMIKHLQSAYADEDLVPVGPVYRNFVEHVTSIPIEQKLRYWKELLMGVEPVNFPTLVSVKSQISDGNVSCMLKDRNYQSLRLFCEQQGATPFSVLQAAWALVLKYYCGVQSVCFGYLASGRDINLKHIDDAIGAFVNMLICRTDFSDTVTSHDLVKQVNDRSLANLENQHCALSDIQHEIGLAGKSLFNSVLSYQRQDDDDEQQSDEQKLLFVDLEASDPTEYDIAIDITISNDSLDLSLDYSAACINGEQAQRVLEAINVAVECLIQPEPVALTNISSQLGMVGLGLMKKFNGIYPEMNASLIHDRIRQRAQETPKAQALVSRDVILDYGQLDALTSKLAHYLASLGCAPEIIVPVCFPKSGWAPICQLAILKAGGVFVSLAPDQPASRTDHILHDTSAKFILVHPGYRHLFSKSDATAIVVDQAFLDSLTDNEHLQTAVTPANAAFVIYTSGTTGTPKGVTITHQALATSSDAHGSRMGIDPGVRVLQYAAFTFDVSVQDVFTTWQRGATVCVISDDERLNIDRLTDAINAQNVTWADLTPSVAGMLDPERVPSLRTISLGGELVPQHVCDMWEASGARVINGYGPAEASINAACSDISQRKGNSSNIGTPLASWFWVVNPWNIDELVPLGCVGELLIESPILARGYLNDQAKTNLAFIKDPQWAQSAITGVVDEITSRRMYRTGDLVRMTEEGTYVFVGRADRQVKLHGQRVELAEIEQHLRRVCAPELSIKSLAVEVVQSVGHRCVATLAAFFEYGEANDSTVIRILSSDPRIEQQLSTIRAGVKQHLASHMVPSLYVPVNKLPINASAKLDRKTLQNLLGDLSADDIRRLGLQSIARRRRTPKNDAERQMQELWSAVLSLNVKDIEMEDNFLSLGGDSIVAMKLARQAKKVFGLYLSVPQILKSPILADMATIASTSVKTSLDDDNDLDDGHALRSDLLIHTYEPFTFFPEAKDTISRLRKAIVDQCQSIQTGNGLEDVHPVTDFQASCIASNLTRTHNMLNYFTWEAAGEADIETLRNAVNKAVCTFGALRSAFVAHPTKDTFLQITLQVAPTTLSLITYETSEDLDTFCQNLQYSAMGARPTLGECMTRFAVVQQIDLETRRSKKYRLVVRVSHAQYDAVSIQSIWEFIERNCATNNGDVEISENQDDLERFTQGHYVYLLAKQDLGQAQSFWKTVLKDCRMTRIVPLSASTFTSPRIPALELTREIPASLLKSSSHTLATAINAAWAYTLMRLSNNKTVVFGAVISGHSISHEADRIVGACANIVPVRADFTEAMTAADLLSKIQDQSILRQPFETLGARQIFRDCSPWSRNEYYSSFVNHLNFEGEDELKIHNQGLEFDAYGAADEPADVRIESATDEDGLELTFLVSNGNIDRDFAEVMLEMLCQSLCSFYTDPEQPLEQSEKKPTIPLETKATVAEPTRILKVPRASEKTLEDIWAKSLDIDACLIDKSQSFFENGGDLVSAALAAQAIQQNFHLSCTPEQVFEVASFEVQASDLHQSIDVTQ